MILNLTSDQILLMVSALIRYEEGLADSLRRSEYFYRAYNETYRKINSEKNCTLTFVRLDQVPNLKAYLLSHMPVDPDYEYR